MDYRIGRSRVLVASTLLSVLAAAAAPSATPGASVMFGFTADEAATEQGLEQRFDADINAGEMRGWLKTLSSEPNNVGSPHD